jgi:hypothetical protein
MTTPVASRELSPGSYTLANNDDLLKRSLAAHFVLEEPRLSANTFTPLSLLKTMDILVGCILAHNIHDHTSVFIHGPSRLKALSYLVELSQAIRVKCPMADQWNMSITDDGIETMLRIETRLVKTDGNLEKYASGVEIEVQQDFGNYFRGIMRFPADHPEHPNGYREGLFDQSSLILIFGKHVVGNQVYHTVAKEALFRIANISTESVLLDNDQWHMVKMVSRAPWTKQPGMWCEIINGNFYQLLAEREPYCFPFFADLLDHSLFDQVLFVTAVVSCLQEGKSVTMDALLTYPMLNTEAVIQALFQDEGRLWLQQWREYPFEALLLILKQAKQLQLDLAPLQLNSDDPEENFLLQVAKQPVCEMSNRFWAELSLLFPAQVEKYIDPLVKTLLDSFVCLSVKIGPILASVDQLLLKFKTSDSTAQYHTLYCAMHKGSALTDKEHRFFNQLSLNDRKRLYMLALNSHTLHHYDSHTLHHDETYANIVPYILVITLLNRVCLSNPVPIAQRMVSWVAASYPEHTVIISMQRGLIPIRRARPAHIQMLSDKIFQQICHQKRIERLLVRTLKDRALVVVQHFLQLED